MNNPTLPNTTDVLVIGYGPVGAALSALLGRYGIQTLVIDKSKDILMMPRAIALDNEALRILQMVGLEEDAFERIVIPEVKMHCPYLGQFAQANTSGSIDGHPKLVTFYQPDLERALRIQTEKFDQVTVCLGYELVSIQQNDHSVVAVIHDEKGQLHQVQTRYVVGADGASSKVRTLIEQDFKGQSYAEDWLIVDASHREGKAINHIEFICDPKRPTPHMPAPNGRERWEFMLQAGETREEMEQDSKVAELLAPWIKPEDLVIERKAVYRFHARCCERFQVGRVFLVGDAAHITPPFVGQGLVAGLRDVANLGWKLAWVVQNYATSELLDSYDAERRPHAKKMIELAKVMGHLVMPRTTPKALVIHGAMRFIRYMPPLRRHLEELEIKPKNRFKVGFFITKNRHKRLQRGSQIGQSWVRSCNGMTLSDSALGDIFTMVGFGVDPRSLLDERTHAQWLAHGGRFLQIGLRGQRPTSDTPFLEDVSDQLVLSVPRGWIAITRPDRVIMHDGPAGQAAYIIGDCIQALKMNSSQY